ncbi:hypothetical protein C1T17_02405 [Sphingobium sp. SCG-1]|uniref:hypothetical protein n=1 Tax=Sphingobium sp. SCG-1 TaxID=2072936 RepID=UPI000CD69BC2|nr:hypothetical protein [Sphingobium sp. SCG-1]AUW57106.1 hypothetical protein C1T17_02405 [Sphingobium sp. SCG-1]
MVDTLTECLCTRAAGERGHGAPARGQRLCRALAADSDNAALAIRSFRQAVAAGDMPLALKAAWVMDQTGVLPRN